MAKPTTILSAVITNAASTEFRDSEIHTGWLDEHPPTPPDPERARRLAARALFAEQRQTAGPWASDGFRLGGPPASLVVQVDVPVELTGGLDSDGSSGGEATIVGHAVEVSVEGQQWRFEIPDPFDRTHQDLSDGTVLSPMPGTVLEVRVSEGQRVEQGEVLAVVEAMKMELSIKASLAGRVARVAAAAGDQVAQGDSLFEIEEEE